LIEVYDLAIEELLRMRSQSPISVPCIRCEFPLPLWNTSDPMTKIDVIYDEA
jgi:hypothetical protein